MDIGNLPEATFKPTGRIIVHGGGDHADIEVSQKVALAALLFADGIDGHLQGGGGPTVEVGGGGSKTQLEGGTGPNVLIAGKGAASVEGNHAGDVLIGGWTDYDSNEEALYAVLREWSSTAPYATRVKHLMSGGGLNGQAMLNAMTVHDNKKSDSLEGNAGLDLFFADLSGRNKDDVEGLKRGEVVVGIS